MRLGPPSGKALLWHWADTMYDSLSTSDANRGHLLDGAFSIVNRMRDIPPNCRAPFESSFSYYSRTIPKEREIDFADPGQDFNYGDAVRILSGARGQGGR